MRLAFLTPLPPASTGVADYSVEVLARLTARHEIDVFHGQDRVDPSRIPGSCRVHHASGFLNRHGQRPFDLAIYQMGNGPDHAFLYEPLARVPGLLVLHDLVLHHSRARMFLDAPEVVSYRREPSSQGRRDAARPHLQAYRDEVAYSYPEQAGRLDEAHLSTLGRLLPYAYPLFRIPVEASRLTAAHNDFVLESVRSAVPEAEVARIPMAAEGAAVAATAVSELRGRLGIPGRALVVGSFGLLTREKQIETLARAVARAAAALPHLWLLLVGPVPDPGRLARLLLQRGVRERTIVTGPVPFWTLPAHMEAADLVVHLRYPTARETSAALLRVLAQGRPTVISDLEHLGDIPAGAAVRADMTDEEGEVTRAILRLAGSPAARAELGQRARAFMGGEHSFARCLEGYEAAMERARAHPDPAPRPWPAHWPRPGGRRAPDSA
jgi:glycosyltransferase involved in cell wall biosynthesis